MHIEFPQLTERTRFVLAEPVIFANQVFNNLISNAIKFSYPGSAIIVKISPESDTTAIAISDQGIGMPAELVARLFDLEAKTTRPGTNGEPGTGFGMRTAKNFIDLFGGRLEIESRPEGGPMADHGTTVSVFLKSAELAAAR
jgi:signal transduction histidine kinase